MAAYNSTDDYEDGSAALPAEPAEPKPKDEGAQTGLLPKAFFGGKELEPGAVCRIKVVKVFDDQVQVAYVQHEADGEEEVEEAPEADLFED